MTTAIVAAAVVLFFLLLFSLPVGADVTYGADGFFLRLVLGPLRLRLLYPGRKKKEKKKKKREEAGKEKQKKTPGRQGGKLPLFMEIMKIAGKVLSKLRKKVRINTLSVNYTSAGSDPCAVALGYGRASAAAGALRALLENTFRVKELSFHTDVDFQREEPVIYAHAVTVIRLGALLAIAAAAAWELLAAMIRNQSTEGRYRNGKASDQ